MNQGEFNTVLLVDLFGSRREVDQFSTLRVDRDNFESVMRRISPLVQVEVDQKRWDFVFSNLEDFHPDSIFRDHECFDELRALRQRLLSSEGYHLAARLVRARFGIETEVIRQEDVDGAGLLDRLIEESISEKKSALEGLVADALVGFVSDIDESERRSLLELIDGDIARRMSSILRDTEFRRCEAAWRGLFFLLRRFESALNRQIFVVDVSKVTLAMSLRDVGALGDSPIGRCLLETDNVGLIVLGDELDLSVEDVAMVLRVGTISQAFDAEVFVSFSKAFSNGSELVSSESKLWSYIVSQECSSGLFAFVNRIQGRSIYGKENSIVESFGFEEYDLSAVRPLWLNPVFAACALAYDGNRSHIVKGVASNLIINGDGEREYSSSTEIVTSEVLFDRWCDLGLSPFVGFSDSGEARLIRFQSLTGRRFGVR